MAMDVEDRLAMCRVVGVLLVTDGQLTDEEYEFFTELMQRLDVPDDRRGEVTGAVSIDTDITEDLARLKRAGVAEQLIEELHAAAVVDGEETSLEVSIVEKVRATLEAESS